MTHIEYHDFSDIKENLEKLDDIILFSGTLDELNSCTEIKAKHQKFELYDKDYRIKASRDSDLDILIDDVKAPIQTYKYCLMKDGYSGVVRFQENILVHGGTIMATYSGIPIKQKQSFLQKYLGGK